MSVDVFTADSLRGRVLAGRLRETMLLICATGLVTFFAWRVWQAKQPALSEASSRINSGELLVLERPVPSERLLPFLSRFEDPAQRSFVARRISAYVSGRPIPNTGALGFITIARSDLGTAALRARYSSRFESSREDRIRLLTTEDLADRVKPFLAVRTPEEFRRSLLLWFSLLIGVFWTAHVLWSVTGFRGDPYLMPVLLVLSGVGFVMMISLRDPVRDRMSFASFAQGVTAGCLVLFAIVMISHLLTLRTRGELRQWRLLGAALDHASHWSRRATKWDWLALAASVSLAGLLVLFGDAPGSSSARVRLGPVQPVDLIRLLFVLFLAGYFARRWEYLRGLTEKRVLPRLGLPRLDHAVPVILAVGAMIGFFFLQRDLGPAMVSGALFLAMYAIARNRTGLVAAAAGASAAIVYLAYQWGYPAVAATRIRLWLWPWNNGLAEGEQTVQALWAMASGGLTGAGFGRGSPAFIPEAHTDMILAAAGEEAGFAGMLLLCALYAVLIARCLLIAHRARTKYQFFLALGLTLSIALQLSLIGGGVLGILPLSGVVTPFLSYGGMSAVVNFASIGLLLSMSEPYPGVSQRQFGKPLALLAGGLGLFMAAAIAKAAWVQVLAADEVAVTGAVILQEDGSYTMRYNPRLRAIDRELTRGSIYDRNGLPLATAHCQELEKWRSESGKFKINVNLNCSGDDRHYPLEAAAYHVLGDVRTMHRWTATNTAFEEKRSRVRLKGWDDQENYSQVELAPSGRRVPVRRFDYSPLLPILKKGRHSQDEDVRRILEARRDVRISVDGRLQALLTEEFAKHLSSLGNRSGAVIVIRPSTGEILASVSLPLPDEVPDAVDASQFGEYPPGSAFKILTAMAAFRRNPLLVDRLFHCERLPDGRVGARVRGAVIRDDVLDREPHGNIRLPEAIVHSCNAWFAQLGAAVGARDLMATAQLLNMEMAKPNTERELARLLPQASYGQGEVLATPLRMARLAGVIANGGTIAQSRMRLEPPETELGDPVKLIASGHAAAIGSAMRQAVVSGTGRAASAGPVSIAGKTGTAELANAASHAWFIGYLPADAPPAERVAFAILIANGGYGGRAAAPFAPILAKLLEDLQLL